MGGFSPRRVAADSGLPLHEAERLLTVATGRDRVALATTDQIPDDARDRFDGLVARRLAGEPLQYLEGTVQFGPLTLKTDPRALIPRPETEQLWEAVVSLVDEAPGVIVDLCSGSGNLALALKHSFPDAEVHGTDLSRAALDLAAENSELTGLEVAWHHGDLFDALPLDLAGRVDLLVANPPYLADGELDTLPVDVRDHEPHDALVAGPQGDELLRRIASEAGAWLMPGALIACEISEFRSPAVAKLFSGFGGRLQSDLTGRPRFVIGRSAAG